MIARSIWALLAMVVLLQQVATGRVFCHHRDGSWHLETIGATCCDSKQGFTSTYGIPEEDGDADGVCPSSRAPECDDCSDFALDAVQMPTLADIGVEYPSSDSQPAMDLVRSSTLPRAMAMHVNPAVHRGLERSTRMVLRC
jgi:hypothetical protein